MTVLVVATWFAVTGLAALLVGAVERAAFAGRDRAEAARLNKTRGA